MCAYRSGKRNNGAKRAARAARIGSDSDTSSWSDNDAVSSDSDSEDDGSHNARKRGHGSTNRTRGTAASASSLAATRTRGVTATRTAVSTQTATFTRSAASAHPATHGVTVSPSPRPTASAITPLDQRAHGSDSETTDDTDDEGSNDVEEAPDDSSDTASEAGTDNELDIADAEWIDEEQEAVEDLEDIMLRDVGQGPSVDELVEMAVAKSLPAHHGEIGAAHQPSLAEIVDEAIAQVMAPSTVTAAGSKTQRATPALDEPPINTATGLKRKRATPALNEPPTNTATGSKRKRATPALNEHPTDAATGPKNKKRAAPACRKVNGARHSPVPSSRPRVRAPARKRPWTVKELVRYKSVSLGGKMESLSPADRAKYEAAFDDGMTRIIETRCQQARAKGPEGPDAVISMVFRQWMVGDGPEAIFQIVRNATTQDRRNVLGGMFLGLTSFEDLPQPTDKG